MIGTDRLLFLHLHKSGGTFVNKLLIHCVPSAERLGYHLPYREVPADYRDRPVLGTVRNPWAYYVSWYHFQASRPQQNPLFQICSDQGELGFAGTVTNLINLSGDEKRLASLEAALPETYRNIGVNLTKACVGELRERGLGFYSFLYERLYEGTVNPTIVRMEELRPELRRALFTLGHLPDAAIERFLSEIPPLNVSQHEEPSTYYDDRLASLVFDRDRHVIERYGYTR
jgi:hypothetical protein